MCDWPAVECDEVTFLDLSVALPLMRKASTMSNSVNLVLSL